MYDDIIWIYSFYATYLLPYMHIYTWRLLSLASVNLDELDDTVSIVFMKFDNK